jgi:hypothetical protein
MGGAAIGDTAMRRRIPAQAQSLGNSLFQQLFNLQARHGVSPV